MISMNKGILFTICSVLSWATTPVAAQLLLNNSPVFEVLLFNSFFSTLLFVGICAVQGRLKEFRKYKKKDFYNFAEIGLLGVYLSYLTLFIAINYMSPQKAFIMNYTWPLMMILLAITFLKEHITFVKITSVILSFIGVVIVVSEGNFTSWNFSIVGTIFALSGALGYAIYSIKSKTVHYDQLLATTGMIVAYFLLALFSYLGYVIYKINNNTPLLDVLPSLNWGQLAGYAFMGMVPNGLGYLFWMKALNHADIIDISRIVYLTPFVSLVFIHFILGTPILVSSIVGVSIIVTGIFLEKIIEKTIFVPELD